MPLHDEIEALELAIEHHTALISAIGGQGEAWAKQYEKDPATHAQIIQVEARLERNMRKYFRELARDRINKYINWNQYNAQKVQAFNVNVIVDNDGFTEDEPGILMNIIYKTVADGVLTGAVAGEAIFNRPLGITPGSDFIMDQVQKQVAMLVGMKVTKDGSLVPNSKAEYSITDQTRQRIQQSITHSLSLGADQNDAAAAIDRIINDTTRAGVIARTESVNAYNKGLNTFGEQSDAVGKEWQSYGTDDECYDNEAEGPIPFGELFSSGDSEPAAHPNCRCTMRLIYQNELDADPNLFN